MDFESPNKLTIQAYNKNVDSYLKRTPSTYGVEHKILKEWIDNVLSYVKPHGSVLELGSATTRDADYIRSHGFEVQCSDAATGFVNHLRRMNEPAILLDIIHHPAATSYDMVFANAVFPHFTEQDTDKALGNIYKCLNPQGLVVFNVKQGEGEEWVDEKMSERRYIHYWQPYDIYDRVVAAGYEVILLEDGIEGDMPTHIWTRITAQKI
jgi:SAM-dependent methyltransferase